MKPIFHFTLFILVLLFSRCANPEEKDILGFVDPFIGTDGHGHTYPGATLPFGMVQLSPDTRKDSWDGCSGYHYSDRTILGFSHTHLNGTGVGDYGDIRIMPMTGNLKIRPGEENKPGSGYRSSFSHEHEKASPGYYRVFLEDYKVDAELTVTRRCGFHQYTFPASGDAYILIDLSESVVTEKNPELLIRIINDHEISGYRRSSGWAADQVVYFHASFSKSFSEWGIASDGIVRVNEGSGNGKDIQAYVKYATDENEKILVKVGISGVSIEGAKENLEAELSGWDFESVRRSAEYDWGAVLSRISVKGGTPDDMTKFYTALYHCYLTPNLFSDINGSFRGNDGKIYRADHEVYTVFSLWDTYRAWHPLMTILEPGRTVDFIRTFLNIYGQTGLLPVWELAGNETNCMIGYHAVPVIADAYLKGITGFDVETAYQAAKNSAEQDHFGLKSYREKGYIPAEAEGESVSRTLEYAYDDWCIAMMAKKLGKEEDYRYFIERAQKYKNLFDPETRFLRGKKNGMFAEPFDPAEVNFMLTEANTWQYTFYVPQDISGLIGLMGGEEAFGNKLDEMFNASTDLSGRQQADITGLIGQYAHGNEPSHHMAYLYNFIGKPVKTQQLARQIMDELYGASPDGLCGNEDCGQMSAWFVMSAMGFYPVTPGTGYYALGSPIFDEISILTEGGKKFIIKAHNNSSRNVFVGSAGLNGQAYTRSFITHDDIIKGGLLELQMTAKNDSGWGSAPEDRPVSSIDDHLITPVPFFRAKSSTFQDSLTVRISHVDPEAVVIYKKDLPEDAYTRYTGPVVTDKTISYLSYAEINGVRGKAASASFHKIHHNWTLSIKHPYNNQYTGGGDFALIDGQHGGPNFRTGSWQGYHGADMDVTVDMGGSSFIKKVSVSFLQDQRSWIFIPLSVEISVAGSESEFRNVAIIQNDVSETLSEAVIKVFEKEIMENCRYIRIRAVNRGICPAWHPGAGERAWIFADEISLE